MSARREPDWVDAVRIAALALVAAFLIGQGARTGVPGGVVVVALQAAFFCVPLLYARAAGLRPLGDAGAGRPRGRDLLLTAVASMASLWLLKALADLQTDLFQHFGRGDVAVREREQIERFVERAQETAGLAGVSLLAVIPPLCEEMLFRGILLRGLGRSVGPVAAVAGTAALFSLMHARETQYALMAFLGLYFGLLAWLTGSLWPSVLAHAINNAAVVALQVGWGARVQAFRAPAPILVLSGLVFAGALALLALDRRARLQEGLGGGVRASPDA